MIAACTCLVVNYIQLYYVIYIAQLRAYWKIKNGIP